MKKDISKNIGILGGTFDPPHQAHCEISLRAINQYGLKKVLFVPSKNPWQKSVTTSYEDRFNMTNLLTENQSYFEVSDIETINEKQTYTVDTLKNLSIPKNELFFILGADVAIEVRTWSRYEELDSLTNFLIAPRDYIQDELLKKKFPFEYQLIEGEELDISSTNIRNKINDGIALENIIPKSVVTYIEENKIY